MATVRRSTAHEEARRRGQTHSTTRPARSCRASQPSFARRDLEEVRELDPDGGIVVHHRLVDTLGRMLKSGTIDQAMHDAGRDFQAAFIVAQLDPMRAMPILRVPGTGREPDLSERQLHARRRVQEAMQALGGHLQPGRLLGVARAGLPAVYPRVGDAPRLGRPAAPRAAGAGHRACRAGPPGAALRLPGRHCSLKGLTT